MSNPNPTGDNVAGWGAPQQWTTIIENQNRLTLTDAKSEPGAKSAPASLQPIKMPLLLSPKQAPVSVVSLGSVSDSDSSSGPQPEIGKEKLQPSTSTTATTAGSQNAAVQQLQVQQPETIPTLPQASASKPASKPVYKMKRTGFSGPFPFPNAHSFSHASSPLTAATPSAAPSPRNDLGPRPVAGWVPPSKHTSAQAENGLQEKKALNSRLHALAGLDANDPIVLVESDIEMADASASNSVSVSEAPTPSAVQIDTLPETQQSGRTFDDKPYRSWTDENGEVLTTYGALLPPGYKKSDNATFPWICPVRSCRRMLPSLAGLGKHFCNTHRAGSFNDNMDGTLSDMGTWTDPRRGDGKNKQGGTAKPPIVVSKKPMSLDISPMIDPTLHMKAHEPATLPQSKRPSKPSRGGPRHSLGSVKVASPDDSDDSENEKSPNELPSRSRHSRVEGERKRRGWLDPLNSSSSPVTGRTEENPSSDNDLVMANNHRRYDQWLNKDGALKAAFGALLPDGYVTGTAMPDRPWICPVRSCRRLYKRLHELGHHFSQLHRGCLLNDNLDGTLSILTRHDGMSSSMYADSPPRIVSRDPDNGELTINPQRPIYRTPTNIAWVDLHSEETGVRGTQPPQASATPAASVERVEEERPIGVRNDDRVALRMASEDRLYSEWRDPTNDTGAMMEMAGALIPEGYKLDTTFQDRPWICPIRTCRITCRLKRGLGNHFTHSHAGQTLNDNGDGTFSIVGSYTGKESKVVSREPLAPDAPPINAPQLPLMIKEAAKRKAEEDEGETARLNWSYICEVSGYKGTMPDHPGIRHLLSLPRVRELKLVDRLESNPDIRQIGAMVVQITGISHEKKCTTCRRNGTGPFDTCVNSVTKDVEDLRLLFGSYVRACGNCIYMKLASFCSVKAYTPANILATKASRASNEGNGIHAAAGSSSVDAETVDDDYYSMMNVLNRRRSRRIEELDGNNIELQDEASVDDLHPAAKRRRQESSSKAEGKAPAFHKSITTPNSDAPNFQETVDPAVLGEDVEMEDWEQGVGRVLATAPPRGKPGTSSNNEELAFSSRHLLMPGSGSYQRQGRTIQVSKGVSFLATHIPSGSIHKFEPDNTKMRICTLANGKLRVTVDGEPEFVIGANGMFKLSPGKGCKILNRAYVDVVLHVTSVEGAM